MKKWLRRIYIGIVIAIILSLLLTIILGACKLFDAAGVCFIIFAVLIGINIVIVVIIACLRLYKNIKTDGFILAIKPLRRIIKLLLFNFAILFITYLCLNYIFDKDISIWKVVMLSIVLTLLFTKENKK